MEVDKTDFKTFVLKFVSKEIQTELYEKIHNADIQTKKQVLTRNIETGYFPDVCSKYFEEVVNAILTSEKKIEWKFKKMIFDF
jgi:hypothetical protein